jgi:hypothetical protein
MFIEFRPGIPKPPSETRSDLRIALAAVAALALLIALLPEAGSDRGGSDPGQQAPLANTATATKALPDR